MAKKAPPVTVPQRVGPSLSKAPGANCAICPFKDHPIAPSNPRPNTRLAIVSKYPGEEEIKKQAILVGNTGRKVRRACDHFGIPQSKVQWNNLILCRPPEKVSTPEINTAIECCKPRLGYDLAFGRVTAVLCADKKANQVFTGKTNEDEWFGAPLDGQITLGKGKTAQALWSGKAIPAFQPAKCFHKPALWPVFYVCLGRAWDLANGKLPEWKWAETVTGVGEDVVAALHRLESADLLGVDIETNGKDPLTSQITAIGIASRDLWVSVTWPEAKGLLRALVRKILANKTPKTLQNGMFDTLCLSKAEGITVNNWAYDTMYLHTAYVPDLSHKLGYIAAMFFHAPRWKNAKDFDNPVYNARDAGMTVLITDEILKNHLDARGVKHATTLLNLAKVATRMQTIGVGLDPACVERHWRNLGARMQLQRRRLAEFAWKLGFGKVGVGKKRRVFNPDSNAHLKELFFGILKVRAHYWSPKTGRPELHDKALRIYLRDEDPRVEAVAKALQKYRSMNALRRTVRLMLGHTVMHPTPKVNGGGATGRWSYKPAMQNWEKSLRDMIVARPGYFLLEADKKQMEARIGAALNKEPHLLDAIARGIHPYKDVQAKVFGPKSLGDDTLYKLSKIGYLASVYFANARTAHEQIRKGMPDLPLRDVERFQKAMFAAYPRLKQGPLERTRQATRDTYIEIPGSRHRYYFYGEPPSPNACANIPVQGFGAHVMNEECLMLASEIDWMTQRIMLQVHDAFIWETKNPVATMRLSERVQNRLVDFENGIKIPLPVEFKVGLNWRPRSKKNPLGMRTVETIEDMKRAMKELSDA